MIPTDAPPNSPAPPAGNKTSPALEPGRLIHRPASWFERLSPDTLFGRTAPLEVELGSGDGSFLVAWAGRNPERDFLGVERLLGRIRKLDRKAQRAGLTNLRGLRIEASYCLEYLLPAGSVAALHVYFPDPWPKRRHHKNRLVNERFAELVLLALAPAGVLHLRTDDADYFARMRAVFDAAAGFRPEETPESLAAESTDFEREFNARGIPTRRASYRKI
jgi:tRNA (guanine-N7-)-methyltransferase